MHFKGDLGCKRGYEGWLAREARRRNPKIKVMVCVCVCVCVFVISFHISFTCHDQCLFYHVLPMLTRAQTDNLTHTLLQVWSLSWGVPGWVGNHSYFSDDNIEYVTRSPTTAHYRQPAAGHLLAIC